LLIDEFLIALQIYDNALTIAMHERNDALIKTRDTRNSGEEAYMASQ